jgi:hypothetical protein
MPLGGGALALANALAVGVCDADTCGRRFLLDLSGALQLEELLQEVRTSPIRQRYSPFPFGQVERVVLKLLDVIERKWLLKKWVEQRLKRENR